MNEIIYYLDMKVFIITIFLFNIIFSFPLHSMWFPDPLSDIEHHLFAHRIQQLGKDTVTAMIEKVSKRKRSTHNATKSTPYFVIDTKIRFNQEDTLSKLIINSITQQELISPYRSRTLVKKRKNEWHITLANNYIGNYSQYWYKKDSAGEYIEIQSSFTYKPALLDVLNLYY
jgi:hypothetical protein